MSSSSKKNARTIGIRLDDITTRRVEHLETGTGIEAVNIARAALDACLRYFESHGTLTLPLSITPTAERPAPKRPQKR